MNDACCSKRAKHEDAQVRLNSAIFQNFIILNKFPEALEFAEKCGTSLDNSRLYGAVNTDKCLFEYWAQFEWTANTKCKVSVFENLFAVLLKTSAQDDAKNKNLYYSVFQNERINGTVMDCLLKHPDIFRLDVIPSALNIFSQLASTSFPQLDPASKRLITALQLVLLQDGAYVLCNRMDLCMHMNSNPLRSAVICCELAHVRSLLAIIPTVDLDVFLFVSVSVPNSKDITNCWVSAEDWVLQAQSQFKLPESKKDGTSIQILKAMIRSAREDLEHYRACRRDLVVEELPFCVDVCTIINQYGARPLSLDK